MNLIRLVSIILFSFASVVPFLAIFHRVLGLENDVAGYISFFLAWIVTPLVLLNIWKQKPSPEVIPINPDDPIILEQLSRSRSEIKRFFVGLEEGKMEAFIKFPYEFSGEIEHVWGTAHKEKDGKIIVSLDSVPIGDAPEETFERISIDKNEIEDWMLVNNKGETFGGYSILALAKIYTRDFGSLPKAYSRDLNRFHDFSWPENA